MQRLTLAQGASSRKNSLNAIRLILVSLVIVSHAPLITGAGVPYMWSDMEVGGWAVAGFFAISGWLISTSRLNLDFAPFFWRRCLRILPAFWCVLVVTAFGFAPLSTMGDGGSYDPLSAIRYIVQNLGLWIFQPGIDATLATNPSSTWNLSLWTLSWEMLCYLAVGILFFFKVVRTRPSVMVSIFVLVATANTIVRATEIIAPGSAVGAGLRLASFFLAGALLRSLAHRIPVNWMIAAASAAIVVVLTILGFVGALGALPIAYLCLYGGVKLPLTKVGAKNDISYGMYVYGFPVGQLIVAFGGRDLNIFVFIALNTVLTVPLAWASWLFIERPALRWKNLVPQHHRAESRI